MNELNLDGLVRLLLFAVYGALVLLLVIWVTLLAAICRHRLQKDKTSVTGTGTFCGHCGKRITGDPVRAIGTGDSGYFVYNCPACQNETLLPSQSVGG
jgi:hypothetical protein